MTAFLTTLTSTTLSAPPRHDPATDVGNIGIILLGIGLLVLFVVILSEFFRR